MNVLFKTILILWFCYFVISQRINYNCRFSPNAAEYSGSLSRTEAGIPCARWDDYRKDDNLTDDDFIDGSVKDANNYCRNPSGNYPWPWCYTTDKDVSDLPCELPLCSFDCRMTLIAMEYIGHVNKTISDQHCQKWSEKKYRKYLMMSNISTSARELDDKKFADGTRKKAKNRCRNPTGDINGPWCLTEHRDGEGNKIYDKEYCQVDFCDTNSSETVFATAPKEESVHSHYIKIPNNNENKFNLNVLLWHVADFKKAEFRIAITTLPVLLNGENLFKMETGIELLIKFPLITFVSYQNESWVQHTRIAKIISGVRRQKFTFEWFPQNFYIEVTFSKSVRKADYADKNKISETLFYLKKGEFTHYSVMGDLAHWTADRQPNDSLCEEHVTLNDHCSKYYKKLRANDAETTMGTDYILHFHLRSKATTYIELRNTPAERFPYFRIDILGAFNKTTLQLFENRTSLTQYLSVVTYENIISNNHWSQFTLSLVRGNFQLIWLRDLITPETIFNLEHHLFRNKQWITFCSAGMATWLFDCPLEHLTKLPKIEGKECARSPIAVGYEGTQAISKNGVPCLPWVYPPVVKASSSAAFSQGRLQALNYCRNPDEDSSGAYCYVADPKTFPELTVKKEYCDVPACPLTECKFSGNGRDYNGSVNLSWSGRKCTISKDPPQTSNVAYCRNPTQNRFGPYCHTEDPTKKYDLCPVPDCEVNDNCTIILESNNPLDRWIVVDPDWYIKRFKFKVKIWDPISDNGFAISLFTNDRNPRYWITISIGINLQNKVQLSYVTGSTIWDQVPIELKTKVIPRLIPKGYWQGFWIQLLPFPIELGYEDSDVAIISWTRPNDEDLPAGVVMSKTPRTEYLSFTTLGNVLPTPVGINIPCHYRLVERTRSFHEGVYFPINLWKTSDSTFEPFTVHVRAVGLDEKPLKYAKDTVSRVSIGFYEYTNTIERLWLHIYTNRISFTRSASDHKPSKNILSLNLSEPLIRHDQWTTFTFIYTEKTFGVSYQLGNIINYTFPESISFTPYYFTVLATFILATWTANYPPPDVDSYINGSWGEWSDFECSNRCGGGFGSRYRECNNPRPSFKGYPCFGKPKEDGECNRFECGCLNPFVIDKINQSVVTSSTNVEVKQSDNIRLECSESVIDIAKIDSPKSKIEWLKDGFRIDGTLMALEELGSTSDSNYKVKHAQPEDAGIYTCVIYPECNIQGIRFVTVRITALVVRTKNPTSIHKGKRLKLECNSAVLKNFFEDLTQSWYLDDLVFINYTETELQEVNYEVIDSVDDYHAGIWECRIRKQGTQLEWITNRIELEVSGKQSLLSYFAEEDALSFFFYFWNLTILTIFLILIIILEIAAVAYVVLWFRRKRRELLDQK